MKEIFIIKDYFEDFSNLNDFFSSKNITIKLVDYQDLENINSSKSTLIIHDKLVTKLGDKSNLLKIARNIGSVKVIVLKSESNDFSIEEEMGGAYLTINYDSLDEVIKETVFQLISSEKYSFSDKKTLCLINMVEKVAKTDVTVFIHGPTGTGKEVISNLIHKKSSRIEKPFVAINCAAIPENMLEAMLFGHEKGAFTGASSANKGIFRAADTGTLLLDEISEMPLSLQAKLLRVLQEKKVTPIGGQRDIDVDVRVIATTNRDMINEVKEKKFREDLYYRLNVFPIETHNLSERPDDILPISVALLKRHINNNSLPYISKKAQKILRDYSWPGNVRELENVLQRSIVLCEKNIIDEKDIMIDVSNQSNFYNSVQENLSEKKIMQA
ncbi:MAG: sigma 54-interacting transcriptional regulator [Alphaproteobacteria bacterium]